LCGSEEYDLDEFEQFPEEIQMLDDTKVSWLKWNRDS
jgi:hypothetical protein